MLGYPRDFLEDVAQRAGNLYRPFPKCRPGKKPRIIDNPIPPLKDIQARIYGGLLRDFPFPPVIRGAVKGGSPEQNAATHVRKRYVITFDVADCFPSISNSMVFRIWRHIFGHSPTVARLLTKLTTVSGHLPQGAPTSSSLANIALLPCVEEVVASIEGMSLGVGQFVDDLAISGNIHDFSIVTDICKAFSHFAFRVGRKKVRIMGSGYTQVVTGLTVNSRVGVPRKKRAQIRAAVHQLELEDPRTPQFQKRRRSVRGRALWLARFHPTCGAKLQERIDKIAEMA